MSPFCAAMVENLYEADSSTSSSFESMRIEAPPPTKTPSLALIDFEELPPPVTPTETTVSPPKSKPALMIGLTSAACEHTGTAAAEINAKTGKDFRIALRVIVVSPGELMSLTPECECESALLHGAIMRTRAAAGQVRGERPARRSGGPLCHTSASQSG